LIFKIDKIERYIPSFYGRAQPMRIIKRGGGEASKVAGNVSVKMEMVQGDRVRATIGKPKDRPVYRNEVLEELSAAAREALQQPKPKR
jgi:sRNA-binding carbon storage regulator CsrA